MKIDLNDGKYTYVFDNGKQYALRYGEQWRDLTGDNLIYWMACRIEELEDRLADYEDDSCIFSVNLGDEDRRPYSTDDD